MSLRENACASTKPDARSVDSSPASPPGVYHRPKRFLPSLALLPKTNIRVRSVDRRTVRMCLLNTLEWCSGGIIQSTTAEPRLTCVVFPRASLGSFSLSASIDNRLCDGYFTNGRTAFELNLEGHILYLNSVWGPTEMVRAMAPPLRTKGNSS